MKERIFVRYLTSGHLSPYPMTIKQAERLLEEIPTAIVCELKDITIGDETVTTTRKVIK